MDDRSVVTEVRGSAMWITLNRPEAMNAISPAMIEGVGRALDEALGREDARAVVLTGAGRAFSAGADLKYVRGETGSGEAGAGQFLNDLLALLNRLERFPLPVIAAVNGLALAGGLELVLCCDLVFAAKSARFGDAHANYGLLPGGGGSVRLPRRIGAARAKYLMFTGEVVSAAVMEAAGLVNQAVEDGELGHVVDALAATIAAKSPLGVSRMKTLVNDGLEQPLEVALRQELVMSALHEHSDDVHEGLAAFQQKRAPHFIGR